jgi:hypothetical protein
MERKAFSSREVILIQLLPALARTVNPSIALLNRDSNQAKFVPQHRRILNQGDLVMPQCCKAVAINGL